MSEETRDSPVPTNSGEKIDAKRPDEQPENEEEEEKYYSGTEGGHDSEPRSEEEESQEAEQANETNQAQEPNTEDARKEPVADKPANQDTESSGSEDDTSGTDEPAEAPRVEQTTSSGIDMNNALAKARAIAAKLGTMQKPQAPGDARTEDSGAAAGWDKGDNVSVEQGEPHNDTRGQDQHRQQQRRSASPEPRASRGTRGSKRERSRSRDRGNQRHELRRDPRRRFDGPEGSGYNDSLSIQQEQPVMEFLVPSELSGLIIGRSGSNLRSIEQRHGVRVQFDSNFDKRAPERRITIEGPAQQADGAKQDIMDFIDRHHRQQQQPFRSPALGQMDGMPAADAPVGFGGALDKAAAEHGSAGMAVITVPSSKVGLIIGRRGESIKNIQSMSGARVQVQPDDGRGAPERPIHLIGSPDQIELARMRIMEIVTTDKPPFRDAGGPHDGFGRHDYAPPSSGHPMSMPHPQGSGGPHGQPPQAGGGGYGGGRMSSGGYGMPQDRYGGGPSQQSQMGDHVEELQIPAEAVGIIIGRGGETIKHLQQSSGTRIQIRQGPDQAGPFRTVTVSGEINACMRGRRMIEDKIDGMQERMGAPPSAPAAGGGYGGPRGGSAYGGYGHQQQPPQHHQQQPVGGGYGGYGYGAEPMDVVSGSDQKPQPWAQPQQPQQQPQYYGGSGGSSAPAYGGYQQPQQQQPQQQQNPVHSPQQQQQQQTGGEHAMQWTNKQTADYYAQYAATNPEYAQYVEYYRKLAENDPNGIVPSG
ncbi:hypothetical protein LPJ74_002004 [Coemansia sp. RSA 1843]|nr:hypothetical protein LPJ74_002004 [Coemansia sp. RSA 1843]